MLAELHCKWGGMFGALESIRTWRAIILLYRQVWLFFKIFPGRIFTFKAGDHNIAQYRTKFLFKRRTLNRCCQRSFLGTISYLSPGCGEIGGLWSCYNKITRSPIRLCTTLTTPTPTPPHPKLAVNWQSIFYGIFSSFLLLATTNPLSVLAENPVISRT